MLIFIAGSSIPLPLSNNIPSPKEIPGSQSVSQSVSVLGRGRLNVRADTCLTYGDVICLIASLQELHSLYYSSVHRKLTLAVIFFF